MFVRLLRQDGSKLYVGAIGTQYSAFLLAANGKKLVTYPCTGSPKAAPDAPDAPGWDVAADPIPAEALLGVTAAQVEVTDGNCYGSIDVGLPPDSGCPW
ncbi:MAG: hypothetical protein EXR79_10230 [Myxococcales bacterium]|nr:hypothetical protein [Myxococcales bacterium]